MSTPAKPVQLPVGKGIEGFHCGNKLVDGWAKHRSATARKRESAVVYASYCDGSVAGFYMLSTHSVARKDVDGGWFTRNAPAQVPAVLLGMLGVDRKYQGIGLGVSLLKDAVENALKVAALAGAKAMIVDPVDETAAAFYRHFGFTELPGTDRMALKL